VHRFVLFVERILPISILAMAAALVPTMMLAPQGIPRVQHLREDPVAVERIARDELGLVRTSEVVFQFPRR
jgi:cell division protein FtsB